MAECDFIISQFIDDELTLDEKTEFVQRSGTDAAFRSETLALLDQEKLVRQGVVEAVPREPEKVRPRRFLRPITLLAATLAMALLGLSGLLLRNAGPPVPTQGKALPHRFLLYEPSAERIELVGSFTDWRKVSLVPLQRSGYWEITLDIPAGEQRYAFILDGTRRVTDPTVPVTEADDFGGENSILMEGPVS